MKKKKIILLIVTLSLVLAVALAVGITAAVYYRPVCLSDYVKAEGIQSITCVFWNKEWLGEELQDTIPDPIELDASHFVEFADIAQGIKYIPWYNLRHIRKAYPIYPNYTIVYSDYTVYCNRHKLEVHYNNGEKVVVSTLHPDDARFFQLASLFVFPEGVGLRP